MVMKTFRGHTPKLGERVWVDDSAVLIGDVEIGDDSSVWPQVSIRGDMHRIRIGARTSVQDNSLSTHHPRERLQARGLPAHHRRRCDYRPYVHATRLHYREPSLDRHELNRA